MIEALQSPGAKSSYQIMEEALGVRLYGDETFEELMKIKETGVHPRKMSYEDAVKLEQEKADTDPDYIMKILDPDDFADGGKVPAAPSQLVSESDMILGYRGPGEYQGGGGGNKSGGGSKSGGGGGPPGGGGGGQDASQDDFSPSPSPATTPVDLGFIGSTTTFTPSEKYGPTGTKIIGPGPTGDGPGPDYVMSTTPEPSLLEKAIATGSNLLNNPITRNLGLGAITMINPVLGGKIRQGMAIKGMLDLASDISLEDLTLGGGDVTGQTTALYKDGGLASMFVEKR
jgi:hypothetical protein